MNEFSKLFNDLKKTLRKIDSECLKGIYPTTPPDKYELKVRAFCILSHAAIEEYFETTALTVLNKSIDGYLNPKPKINDALITLAAYSAERLDTSKYISVSPFVSMKNIYEKAKSQLSTEIVVDNHGISIKHLTNILLPVSLQIKDDMILRNSLDQLVKERGEFAHKGKIKHILSPDDARNYVGDCILLCDDIKNKAIKKFN